MNETSVTTNQSGCDMLCFDFCICKQQNKKKLECQSKKFVKKKQNFCCFFHTSTSQLIFIVAGFCHHIHYHFDKALLTLNGTRTKIVDVLYRKKTGMNERLCEEHF